MEVIQKIRATFLGIPGIRIKGLHWGPLLLEAPYYSTVLLCTMVSIVGIHRILVGDNLGSALPSQGKQLPQHGEYPTVAFPLLEPSGFESSDMDNVRL